MLIILDRDGVINYESHQYIKSPEEWKAIPDSLSAIARLNKMGYIVVVATNQSGLHRHYYSEITLESIHQKMQKLLAAVGGHLDGIYFCPHTPQENCLCRKPEPGLLLQIAKDFDYDLKQACFIGDSLKDIQAAQRVGALPLLVRTGRGDTTLKAHPNALQGVAVYTDLNEASKAIIQGKVCLK